MTNPLVTVITPTYNAARWLPDTIASILGQDYPHMEYLILDDGSTDNTQEVLSRYGSDKRLRRFHHPNMGEVRSINKGYEQSYGSLLGVVSADDPIAEKDWLSRIVESAQRCPEALVFYPDFYLTDKDNRIITPVITREWDYDYMVSHHHCTPGCGAAMRREVLEKVGFRNPDPSLRWVADLEYWLRVGRVGPMVRVPYLLANHRRHPDQLTLKMQGRAMAAQHIYLYETYFAQVGLPPRIVGLRDQAMAHTYLTCAYVCPGNYVSMAKYLTMALRAWPPIIKDIGPLALSKGVKLFSHTKGS